MAQTQANKEYATFVRGIVTEASPLTFPENASIDEQNFVLNRDGSRNRRLGMDYEPDAALIDTNFLAAEISDRGVSVHNWFNINEDSTLSFYVVQYGNELYFYDALKETTSLSPKNNGVPLFLGGDGTQSWQMASLGGRLIIVNGFDGVYSLTYDASLDFVGVIAHGLLSRDVWGIDDGLSTDERPLELSATHEYNLLNQGWGAENPDVNDSYYETFAATSGTNTYPSNADLVSSGKKASDDDVFDGKQVARAFTGNTPAPKGTHVIDTFDRSGSRAFVAVNTGLLNNGGLETGHWIGGIYGHFPSLIDLEGYGGLPTFSGLPTDRTNTGVTVVTTYAERFFYSGMESALIGGDSKSPLLGHLVFFSQLVDAADKVGKCYQDADPSSDEQSDLVATDGGFIKIPEMSRCLKLVPYADSLVVFAENGVWEIKGGETGFKATEFQVIKLTDVGAVNSGSIVDVEDRIYFWSTAGIYIIFRDQVSLGLQISNISETSIQTLFEGFSSAATSNVLGAYDPVKKQVRWLLNNTIGYDGTTERFQYNVEIVLDILLEAWYISKLPDPDGDQPYLSAYLVSPSFLSTALSEDVVVDGDQVVSSGLDVVVSSDIRQGDTFKIKYLITKPSTLGATYKHTFSLYNDASFEDWATNNSGIGTDASAFLLTGYETGGDTQRQKQVKYITTHFMRTEQGFVDIGDGNLEAVNPSSCLIQSQWDFTDSAVSGKFGPEFQAYRLKRNFLPAGAGDLFDYGWKVITTKHKLRGRGRALSLLFKTEPQKDLVVYGWGVIFGVNTDV